MRKRAEKNRSSIPVKILNMLIVLVLLVFIFMVSHMITEPRRAYSKDYSTGIQYYLEDGNYGGMVQNYFFKYYDVAPFPSQYEEYYQIGAYANAAFQQRFFQSVGDTLAQERYQIQMDQARGLMGDLVVAADDIDAILSDYPQK